MATSECECESVKSWATESVEDGYEVIRRNSDASSTRSSSAHSGMTAASSSAVAISEHSSTNLPFDFPDPLSHTRQHSQAGSLSVGSHDDEDIPSCGDGNDDDAQEYSFLLDVSDPLGSSNATYKPSDSVTQWIQDNPLPPPPPHEPVIAIDELVPPSPTGPASTVDNKQTRKLRTILSLLNVSIAIALVAVYSTRLGNAPNADSTAISSHQHNHSNASSATSLCQSSAICALSVVDNHARALSLSVVPIVGSSRDLVALPDSAPQQSDQFDAARVRRTKRKGLSRQSKRVRKLIGQNTEHVVLGIAAHSQAQLNRLRSLALWTGPVEHGHVPQKTRHSKTNRKHRRRPAIVLAPVSATDKRTKNWKRFNRRHVKHHMHRFCRDYARITKRLASSEQVELTKKLLASSRKRAGRTIERMSKSARVRSQSVSKRQREYVAVLLRLEMRDRQRHGHGHGHEDEARRVMKRVKSMIGSAKDEAAKRAKRAFDDGKARLYAGKHTAADVRARFGGDVRVKRAARGLRKVRRRLAPMYNKLKQ